MLKTTLKILFSILFLIVKKIFIRENRVPHKIMDNLANKLHSIFLYTSFPSFYIYWFDIKIFSLSSIIIFLLFLQLVIIVRYFNPKMLEEKQKQIDIMRKINKISLFIFIFNWIFLSFLFALSFTILLLVNNGFYLFIVNQIKKQREQEEFAQQFGEDVTYSKNTVIEKHIINLFESNLDIDEITKSDIKKQYRIMAKKYHPDVYKGEEQDKFRSINLSYQYLTDLKQ
jgi:hypothetical protein